MGRKKALLLALLMGVAATLVADDVSDLFQAYSDQDFSLVQRLLKKNPTRPEYRFISALTMMHDKNRNKTNVITAGFKQLQELYLENSAPDYLKPQLELIYARSAQLIDTRPDLYGDLGSTVDYIAIYDKIMQESPDTENARNAMFFKLDHIMDIAINPEKYPEEKDGNVLRAPAVEETEKFIASFKGDPKLLIPLRLYLHHIYIAFFKDYEQAVGQLIAADETGIVNPKLAQDKLYQIGRTYQLFLDDSPEGREQAIKYLSIYIEKFPLSNYTPVAERIIKELQEDK